MGVGGVWDVGSVIDYLSSAYGKICSVIGIPVWCVCLCINCGEYLIVRFVILIFIITIPIPLSLSLFPFPLFSLTNKHGTIPPTPFPRALPRPRWRSPAPSPRDASSPRVLPAPLRRSFAPLLRTISLFSHSTMPSVVRSGIGIPVSTGAPAGK